VIGLTGNIATGKSVVRRMLEHLGAYTIDADVLSHRAIERGAPGYRPVVENFGKFLLNNDGEINRKKLGDLAFRDPAALVRLEGIIHPLVGQAVDVLVKRASQPVIVIEAIKLLEGNLRSACDSVWVTYAPVEVQIERLMRKRNLTREQALQRIQTQAPQSEKISAANVVIRNLGSYDDLWKQVTASYKESVPSGQTVQPARAPAAAAGELTVSRGGPKNSEAIADFINRMSDNKAKVSAEDIMADFGEKAYMLLLSNQDLAGVIAWQVENLVARLTSIYLKPTLNVEKSLRALITEVERACSELQCEASLIFPTKALGENVAFWKNLGYEPRTPTTLGVQAWTDAALESMPKDSLLFFKQMRKDRVLRPI
jgi:dephospho-CoA kinase